MNEVTCLYIEKNKGKFIPKKVVAEFTPTSLLQQLKAKFL